MVSIKLPEMKTSFSIRRAAPVYLLASMQLVIFLGHAIAYSTGWQRCNGSFDLTLFAGVFQIFQLRLAVFFGCVVIFLNLFRGEVVRKSLHYYFLAPVRREVLVAGKYLAGSITAVTVFTASTILSYLVTLKHLASDGQRRAGRTGGRSHGRIRAVLRRWPASATARCSCCWESCSGTRSFRRLVCCYGNR